MKKIGEAASIAACIIAVHFIQGRHVKEYFTKVLEAINLISSSHYLRGILLCTLLEIEPKLDGQQQSRVIEEMIINIKSFTKMSFFAALHLAIEIEACLTGQIPESFLLDAFIADYSPKLESSDNKHPERP